MLCGSKDPSRLGNCKVPGSNSSHKCLSNLISSNYMLIQLLAATGDISGVVAWSHDIFAPLNYSLWKRRSGELLSLGNHGIVSSLKNAKEMTRCSGNCDIRGSLHTKSISLVQHFCPSQLFSLVEKKWWTPLASAPWHCVVIEKCKRDDRI